MSSKPKWHSGPPPSVGWWPASLCRDPRSTRWWDGKRWSIPVTARYTAREAARNAAISEFLYPGERIEWTDHPKSWPERSKT